MNTQEITQKLCECGCGQPAPIAKRTHNRYGWIKGQPKRFILGHAWRAYEFPPAEQRFWEKVDKNGPIHPILQTACWVWTSTVQSGNYGSICTGGISILAHRYSYELHNGPIPEGILVCHKCDNPPCVNPEHLFLGTHGDNSADMHAKNRRRHDYGRLGESNPSAKLTAQDVLRIRELAQARTPRRQLADMFGVSLPLIEKIISRSVWSHI